MSKPSVLITGAAGFIGMHACSKFHSAGYAVEAIDNFDPYYSNELKRARCKYLKDRHEILVEDFDVNEINSLSGVRFHKKFDLVLHLAAQPGVRFSLEKPQAYIRSNVSGFLEILEYCRKFSNFNLMYASSSSVYGENPNPRFSENDKTDFPISLYAATKKANELMAYTYSHLFELRSIGLRFFTVYGPWGRPDMAVFKFTKAINENRPIDLYGEGKLWRDFTFVDDIVSGILSLAKNFNKIAELPYPINPDNSKHSFFNIGNHQPRQVIELVAAIEKSLGKKAIINFREMQQGDVHVTSADTQALRSVSDFAPNTSLEDGVEKFVSWYLKEGFHY
ncbi:MAG: NAD-dependent epimerase/dehydratase family protein [Pseudomonadota bacterium]